MFRWEWGFPLLAAGAWPSCRGRGVYSGPGVPCHRNVTTARSLTLLDLMPLWLLSEVQTRPLLSAHLSAIAFGCVYVPL